MAFLNDVIISTGLKPPQGECDGRMVQFFRTALCGIIMLQRCAYWAKLKFFLVGAFHAILLWYAPLKICIKTQHIIYGVMINPLRILLLFLLRVSIFKSTCCHLFDNSHLPNIVNFWILMNIYVQIFLFGKWYDILTIILMLFSLRVSRLMFTQWKWIYIYMLILMSFSLYVIENFIDKFNTYV